jgi:hypothetical protein
MKLSAKQQALILKARNQCIELEKIQESILQKLYFDLDIEETENTSDVLFDALYADWKSEKELLRYVSNRAVEFTSNSHPTGTVITRCHPSLNFGQTVFIINEGEHHMTVNPMGDIATFTVHKELIWPTSKSEDAEGKEKALEKNGCYSYIASNERNNSKD